MILMKKFLSIVFFLSFLLPAGLLSYGQTIPAKPQPPRLVNDLAHAMTADQVAVLENKLDAYDDSTSVQIAVITMATIGDDAIEDVALKILRVWGVGNKKTNNGMVILAAIKEHKVYIATGYGMEGSIPDLTAKQIGARHGSRLHQGRDHIFGDADIRGAAVDNEFCRDDIVQHDGNDKRAILRLYGNDLF